MNTIRKISYSKLSAHSGFTLVEVMVTVVILGVIATIATPSISNQLANQRVKSTTTTLMNVLREARSESNINRMPVTVSYINNSQSYNVINVEVPYSGPLLSFSLMRTIDWMGFFMNSALALDTPPKNPDNNGGGTTGGGTTGGGTTGGGTTGGGTTGGGTTGGGTTGGGTTGGGTTGGGTTGGGTTGGGTTGGGTTGGGTTGGGTTGGGTTGGGTTGGGTTGGGTTGGGTTGGGTTGGGTTGGGTTGGGTTGGGTTGGGTTGGGTTGGGTTGGGTNSNLVIIATYKYDLRTTINSSANRITFKPNKNVDAAVTYTICDTNKSVSPRQVSVSINGLISSKLGGSCS